MDEAADAFEEGIDRTAAILEQLADSKPDVVSSIAALLGMSEVLQTYRMAGAIVANAKNETSIVCIPDSQLRVR